MTALTSSLIAENKWQQAGVILLVGSSPLMLFLSGFALDDLAVAYFTVFSVLYFLRAIEKQRTLVIGDFGSLFLSAVSLGVILLIKPNILIAIPMWLLMLYVTWKSGSSFRGIANKLVLIVVLLPLIYEAFADVPYVVSVWALHDGALAMIFHGLLLAPVSPAEMFVELFKSPSWAPTNPTLFSQSLSGYAGYFYALVAPESRTMIVSSIILASPLLFLWRSLRSTPKRVVLGILVLSSSFFFFLEALVYSSLSEVSRYSLWMIPLWVPLALIVMQDLKDNPSIWKLVPIAFAMILIVETNVYLVKHVAYFSIGYNLVSVSSTTTEVELQVLLALSFLIVLALGKRMAGRCAPCLKRTRLLEIGALALCLLILCNATYFTSYFADNSPWYESHGYNSVAATATSSTVNETFVVSNENLYLAPYLPIALITSGTAFPPPDTAQQFSELLSEAPNGSVLVVGNDPYSTLYYGNSEQAGNGYIRSYPLNGTTISETEVQSLPDGHDEFFDIQHSTNTSAASLRVSSAELSLGSNQTVDVNIALDSSQAANATIVLASPFFSQILGIRLEEGSNHVVATVERTNNPSSAINGGYDWAHSGQLWVFVLSQGQIVYAGFLALGNDRVLNALFAIAVTALVWFTFLGLSFMKGREGEIRANKVPTLEKSRSPSGHSEDQLQRVIAFGKDWWLRSSLVVGES
jgi:hypothetical protein